MLPVPLPIFKVVTSNGWLPLRTIRYSFWFSTPAAPETKGATPPAGTAGTGGGPGDAGVPAKYVKAVFGAFAITAPIVGSEIGVAGVPVAVTDP